MLEWHFGLAGIVYKHSFDAVSKASGELSRAIFHVMLLENAMGKGQGTEWERVGHILIGLGHHNSIGSLRSQSLHCKNKHLSLSCLGKNRDMPASGCALRSSGFVLLPWQSLRLDGPVNRTEPSNSEQHLKQPLCLLLWPL